MIYRAVCIGINKYPGSPLYFCVKDAEEMTAMLFGLFKFKMGDVRLVTDEAATASYIKECLRWVVQADRYFIDQSGHGSQRATMDPSEPDKLDELFCPINYNPSDRSTMLLDDDYHEILCGAKPGSLGLFLSDSCHSDGMLKEEAEDVKYLRPKGEEGERVRLAQLKGVKKTCLGSELPPGVVMLAACKSYQTAVDGSPFGDHQHGAFHGALLEKWKADKNESLNSLVAGMNTMLGSYGYKQIAVKSGGGLERMFTCE
jgi:hypothetical protein